MRLDLLLDREPFEEVFSRTLSVYLADRFGWNGVIRWMSGDSYLHNSLLVNNKLNLIYPRTLNTSTLRLLASEYAYHPNVARRLIQWLYVRYAVTVPLRELLSCAFVSIDPLPVECSSWCIIPGNNAIRIVDLENDECVVLRKDGFNEQYMRELLLLRGQHPELPGPKLFRFDSSEGWYAEERIHGLPLNRLNNGRRIQEAINRAQQSMLHLYDQTSSEQGYREWKYSIIQQIDAAVEGLPAVYSESLRKQILSTVEMLSSVCFDVDVEGRIIETVQTHGDFQPANILIPTDSDQSSVYLIDWEYTAKRCRWYDALVFELHSRSPKGFADRVSQWLLDKHRAFQLIEWCGLDQTEFLPKFVVASFLLEDLLLRLGDATIPGLLQPNKGFLVFVDELSSVNLDSSL